MEVYMVLPFKNVSCLNDLYNQTWFVWIDNKGKIAGNPGLFAQT